MPNQTAPSAQLSTLLARYRAVRAATLAFTAPLSPEDMMVQSCPEASPIKWHLAHTSWFFETFVLTPYAGPYQPFHPDFHWLFNSYYNSLGEMPAKNLRSSFSRPPLDDILAFRAHVDQGIARLLEEDLGDNEPEILRRIALGLEHEQQHLELAAYDIKHALFTNPLHPAYKEQTTNNKQHPTVPLTFTPFHGGLVEIGLTPDPDDPLAFCFDNETPCHKVFLQPFELANRLVTVREYLAFIEDNGYSRPELWLSEGWTTIRNEAWEAPLYWIRTSHSVPHLREAKVGWSIYTLSGFRPLEDLLETPVCHLSFFEADAFARWSGCRLPTEFEWEHAATIVSTMIKGTVEKPQLISYLMPPTGTVVPAIEANLLETGHLHPTPAQPLHGPQQMYGDVWEWTASPYTGYPGYKPLPGALGEYNGKFMSSQIILRGGSCVTPATHIRATYRNFFSPSTRWQFCGLRLAK
jgi:ergothioneine biosynthesis protein EgtB